MVEIALLAPLLITVLFLIVDAGYWIYGYGSVYNAARRASEQAAKAPPHPVNIDPINMADACVSSIFNQATNQDVFFFDEPEAIAEGPLTIVYPARSLSSGGPVLPRNSEQLRKPGGMIEITVRGGSSFLTPIPALIGLGDSFTIVATSRRTIENLALDPADPSGVGCKPNPIGE